LFFFFLPLPFAFCFFLFCFFFFYLFFFFFFYVSVIFFFFIFFVFFSYIFFFFVYVARLSLGGAAVGGGYFLATIHTHTLRVSQRHCLPRSPAGEGSSTAPLDWLQHLSTRAKLHRNKLNLMSPVALLGSELAGG
jgi:hypothetical protein